MGSFPNRLSRLEKQIGADDSEPDANQANLRPIVDPVAELRRLLNEVKARIARGDPPPRQTSENKRLTEQLRRRLEECRKNLVAVDSPKTPAE